MADNKLAAIWATQKSLTEWLQDINHTDAERIRKEDNDKRERLKVLNEVIGLPFDKPTQFEATDLADNTPALLDYVSEHGDELCALRLIPKDPSLTKLRMRGKSIAEAVRWFHEQKIDPTKYRADFMPHTEDDTWATIFIVNRHGIQGEIIHGGHHQLTQGFHETGQPSLFVYDYDKWQIYPHNDGALIYLKKMSEYLKVEDAAIRKSLEKKLGSTFTNNYLEGYFETTDSLASGTWFIDYSPILGNLYADVSLKPDTQHDGGQVSGLVASPGQARGIVRVVGKGDLDKKLDEDFILVCSVTTPDYVPLMQQAQAIVTDQGGVLSHAAIVARELKKPCIVATSDATSKLQDGQKVMVDAELGIVTPL